MKHELSYILILCIIGCSQTPQVTPTAEELALITTLDDRLVAPGDSNAILGREHQWGSSVYRLGYRELPPWQNFVEGKSANPGYYCPRIDRLIFAQNFSPVPKKPCEYEFENPSYFRTRNRNGLTGLVHDGSGALVQLNKPVWYPYFHKRSPLPFLNMEVAYEVLDSIWVDQWTPLEKRVVIKLYHRDSMLDVFFPERTVVAPFNMHEFRSAYQVIKSHFDSRYQSHYDPLGHNINESNIFKDKPYRDLINLSCWLTPDSVAIELYCFPADILDRYIRIDPIGRLVLDTTTETYHREPAIRKDEDGYPVGDASSVAYEIHSEDLAIWVVYRWLKNPH